MKKNLIYFFKGVGFLLFSPKKFLNKHFPKKCILVMTLLARNEDDIIRQNIEFHLKHGVDFIIATDNASIDKTRSIFKEYERKGKLFLIDELGKDISQAAWNNQMMKMAIEKYKADFIFHCDADEFWCPKSGNLKKEISNSDAEVMTVNLVNVLLENKNGEEIFPRDAKYAVINPIETNDFEEDSKKQNLYFFRYPAKVIFKTTRGPLNVSHGNHNIESDIENLKNDIAKNISIYHFPLRNKKGFYKKIIEHGAAIEKNILLNTKQSWHIRRWREAYKTETLDDEYKKLTITQEKAEYLRKKGMLEYFNFEEFLKK